MTFDTVAFSRDRTPRTAPPGSFFFRNGKVAFCVCLQSWGEWSYAVDLGYDGVGFLPASGAFYSASSMEEAVEKSIRQIEEHSRKKWELVAAFSDEKLKMKRKGAR